MAARTIFTEVGRSGLNAPSGMIQEEFLRNLTGRNWDTTIRQMTENDSVIASTLYAIEMLARQVSWTMEAADSSQPAQAEAEFFHAALLRDQACSWQDTVAEILSMIPWGWSFFEIVYKQRQGESRDPARRSKFTDGRIGWRKFAIRSQDTRLRWEFAEDGSVQALVQLPPPDYLSRTIPIEKALLFRASSRKSSPEGRSLLRGAYVPWYFRNRLERLEGIGVERDLAGLPVAYVPAAMLTARDDASKGLLEQVRQTIASIRRDEEEGIVWPLAFDANGKQLYDLKLLSTGGQRQHNTDAIITRYKRDTLMCLLADFLLLGHDGVGSFALGQSRTSLFTRALNALLDSICETINEYAIPRLAALNAIPREMCPRLCHGPVEDIPLESLSKYITDLAGVGAITFPTSDGALEEYLLEQANLPVSAVESRERTSNAEEETDSES